MHRCEARGDRGAEQVQDRTKVRQHVCQQPDAHSIGLGLSAIRARAVARPDSTAPSTEPGCALST
eukprot:2618734-Prymnesium_polylepis.1